MLLCRACLAVVHNVSAGRLSKVQLAGVQCVVVQSASSELLERMDSLLRCMPRAQPMHGQVMDDPLFLTPDDYTPARWVLQSNLLLTACIL